MAGWDKRLPSFLPAKIGQMCAFQLETIIDQPMRTFLATLLCFSIAVKASAGSTTTDNSVTNQLNTISNQLSSVSNQLVSVLSNATNATPIWSKYFHAEAGIVTLRPFSISPYSAAPGTYELKSGNPVVRGMIQVILQDRYAWRHDYFPYTNHTGYQSASWSFWRSPGGNASAFPSFDLESRVGYTYGGSGSESSSTMGGGDFYGDFSLGMNLFTYWHNHAPGEMPLVFTVCPEGFLNFSSDGQYSLIHTAEGLGLAYVAGIPWNGNKLEFKTRIGYAWVDAPHITGVTTNGNPQVGGASGEPEFSTKGAVDLQGELRVPVSLGSSTNKFGYLSLGGEAYKLSGNNLDQWSVYAAMSFNLETLVKTIASAIQGQAAPSSQ